ncbi:hypothetical protein MYX82_03180 [Acidobacteria bacterium AH-259-D05]|nr:hypothetical protein [Acidobacteria bacterium AH-259-D05]
MKNFVVGHYKQITAVGIWVGIVSVLFIDHFPNHSDIFLGVIIAVCLVLSVSYFLNVADPLSLLQLDVNEFIFLKTGSVLPPAESDALYQLQLDALKTMDFAKRASALAKRGFSQEPLVKSILEFPNAQNRTQASN